MNANQGRAGFGWRYVVNGKSRPPYAMIANRRFERLCVKMRQNTPNFALYFFDPAKVI